MPRMSARERLDRYACGGECEHEETYAYGGDKDKKKKGELAPVTVYSKTDPAYKRYQDSLNIYNKSKAQWDRDVKEEFERDLRNYNRLMKSDVLSEEKKAGFTKPSIGHYYKYDTPSPHLQKITNKNFFKGEGYHPDYKDYYTVNKGNDYPVWDEMYKKEGRKSPIKPVAWHGVEGGIGNFVYKKPVQPVVVKRLEGELTDIDTSPKIGVTPAMTKSPSMTLKPDKTPWYFQYADNGQQKLQYFQTEADYDKALKDIRENNAGNFMHDTTTKEGRSATIRRKYDTGGVVKKTTAQKRAEMMASLIERGTSTSDNTYVPRMMPQDFAANVIASNEALAKKKAHTAKVRARREALRENKGDLSTGQKFTTGEKGRFFPNSVGGVGQVIDNWINPVKQVADLAEDLGNSLIEGKKKGSFEPVGEALSNTVLQGVLGLSPLSVVEAIPSKYAVRAGMDKLVGRLAETKPVTALGQKQVVQGNKWLRDWYSNPKIQQRYKNFLTDTRKLEELDPSELPFKRSSKEDVYRPGSDEDIDNPFEEMMNREMDDIEVPDWDELDMEEARNFEPPETEPDWGEFSLERQRQQEKEYLEYYANAPKIARQNMKELLSGKDIVEGTMEDLPYYGVFDPMENTAKVAIRNPKHWDWRSLFNRKRYNVPNTTVHEGTHKLTSSDYGISQDWLDKLADAFHSNVEDFNIDKRWREYLTMPTETHAVINELRRAYKIKPDDVVDDKMIEKIIKEGLKGKTSAERDWFRLIKSKKGLKDLFNTLPAATGVAAGVGVAANSGEEYGYGGRKKYNFAGPVVGALSANPIPRRKGMSSEDAASLIDANAGGISSMVTGMIDLLGQESVDNTQPILTASTINNMANPYSRTMAFGGDIEDLTQEEYAQLAARAEEMGITIEELVEQMQGELGYEGTDMAEEEYMPEEDEEGYGLQEEGETDEYGKGGWIKKAVNPKHKGYCTPMTKKTCTPRRKALARTFKKHHGFHAYGGVTSYEVGQEYDVDESTLASLKQAGYKYKML